MLIHLYYNFVRINKKLFYTSYYAIQKLKIKNKEQRKLTSEFYTKSSIVIVRENLLENTRLNNINYILIIKMIKNKLKYKIDNEY